jgi:hypothetical protein
MNLQEGQGAVAMLVNTKGFAVRVFAVAWKQSLSASKMHSYDSW